MRYPSAHRRAVGFWSMIGFILHTALVLYVAISVQREAQEWPIEEVGLVWWAVILIDLPSSLLVFPCSYLLPLGGAGDNWHSAYFFLVVGGAQYAVLSGLLYSFVQRRRGKWGHHPGQRPISGKASDGTELEERNEVR